MSLRSDLLTALPGRDRRAIVGILFALMLVPMLGFLGLAIDFGMKTRAQTEINAAADSAALIATSTAANEYSAGNANWKADSQTAGQNFFTAQLQDLGFVSSLVGTDPAPGSTVSVVQQASNASTFTATLTYTGNMNTYFARLFGQPTLQVAGGSTATITASSYVDIHILMDNSSSMLIGASQQDMTDLISAVKKYSNWDGYNTEGQNQDCAFGCHFSNTYAMQSVTAQSAQMKVSQDFYGVAQLTGIQLRLNVVQSAVANVISSMASKQPPNNTLYQVALYAFNDPTKNNLTAPVDSPTTIYPLGPDFSTASNDAQGLQVPLTYDNSNEQDTDIAGALNYVNGIIPTTNGTGTASDHKEYLFLITDGVEDHGAGSARNLAALNPTACQALKNRNVQVYVLYTTYIPITTNSFYNTYVEPFAGNWVSNPPTPPPTTQLSTNLQNCATSASTFFTATDTTDINTQMQNMLNAALGSAGRLVF